MSKRYEQARVYTEKYKDKLSPCRWCGNTDIRIVTDRERVIVGADKSDLIKLKKFKTHGLLPAPHQLAIVQVHIPAFVKRLTAGMKNKIKMKRGNSNENYIY